MKYTELVEWFSNYIENSFHTIGFVSPKFFDIAKEANHKCTGEDCPICACVHQVEQNLKNLGTGFAVDFCAIFSVLSIVSVICCQTENFFCTSLVSQKVRLNN